MTEAPAARTLEQRLRCDHHLAVGRVHTVALRKGDRERLALVLIGKRKPYKVEILPKPEPGDMYLSWSRLNGDKLAHSRMIGCAYVHRDRVLAEFGEPTATIEV